MFNNWIRKISGQIANIWKQSHDGPFEAIVQEDYVQGSVSDMQQDHQEVSGEPTVFGHFQLDGKGQPMGQSAASSSTSYVRKDLENVRDDVGQQMATFRGRMDKMEADSKEARAEASAGITELASQTDARFGVVEAKIETVGATTMAVAAKVQSLEDLMRGMATGQMPLQSTV